MLPWLTDFIKTGNFILTSGQQSDYYVDIKSAVMYPGILHHIIQQIEEIMGYDQFQRVAGVELGGALIASGYSLWTGLPCLTIRHDNTIVGELEKGDRVLLIDDVLTTNGSLKRAEDRLLAAGAGSVESIVVFDRQEALGSIFTTSLAKYEDIKFVIEHLKRNVKEEYQEAVADDA